LKVKKYPEKSKDMRTVGNGKYYEYLLEPPMNYLETKLISIYLIVCEAWGQ